VTHLVRRGGAWYRTLLSNGRSAYRSVLPSPGIPDEFTGFRVVCLPREVAPPRVLLRGGSWDNSAHYCCSAYRGHFAPGDALIGIVGFRVVCLPPPEKDGRRIAVRGGAWNWSSSLWSGLTRSPGIPDEFTGFRVVCLPREVAP